MHVIDPLVELNVPARQARQVVPLNAPIVVEYLPSSQAVHAAASSSVAGLVRYLPALHVVHEVELNPENFPSPQEEHAVVSCPVSGFARNFPAGHAMQ